MLLASVLALAVLNTAQALTSDRQVCYTAKGVSSVENVLTTSRTIVHTATKVITIDVEPTEVVTPTAVVLTDTFVLTQTKTTTASTAKGIPTTTITKTVHVTKTATKGAITTTKTNTVTKTATSISTYTIPTSSGFIPISSSLPGSQGNAKKAQAKQHLAKPAYKARQPRYPNSVTCQVHQTVRTTLTTTVTSSTLTSILVPSTEKTTVTSTSTHSYTAWPSATTTKTVTVTTTKTSTVYKPSTTVTKTSTKTTTTTDVEPGPTYYAACGANNLMPTYQNNTIDFLAGDNQPNGGYDLDAPDLYSCCVACFELPDSCAAGALDHINDPSACEIWTYTDPRPQNSSNHRMDTWGCQDGGSGAFNGYGGEVTDYLYLGGCD